MFTASADAGAERQPEGTQVAGCGGGGGGGGGGSNESDEMSTTPLPQRWSGPPAVGRIVAVVMVRVNMVVIMWMEVKVLRMVNTFFVVMIVNVASNAFVMTGDTGDSG